MQGLHNNNLHGAGHRPMANCLIHNSRIVDEDYSIDWAIREEAQIPLFSLAPFSMRKNHEAAKDPYNFEWFHFGPAVRMANMSGGKRTSRNVIHTGLSLT